MAREADPDATVVLPRGRPRRRARWPLVAGGSAALAGALALLLWHRAGEPPSAPQAGLERARPASPSHTATVAGPLAILAHRAEALTIFKLEQNNQIYVFDFPTLTQQGRMLNRVAALVEKAGLPRDRVLSEAELAVAIAARGETAETFYLGHNYRASDLARFFRLAAAQGVRLNAEESRLAIILDDLGITRRDAAGLPEPALAAAIVTVPALEPAAPDRGLDFAIDESVREAILRHELSHGEFFTNKAFADHVALWWNERLSASERAAFRRFLAEGGYDPELDEVMMNEAMAYLMQTPNPGFFSADAAGIDHATEARLRAEFMRDLPETWLFRIAWPGR